MRLDSCPSAPSAARAALDDLAVDVPDDVRFDLRLLVTELVANAVRHSQADDVRVRAHVEGDRVRVEVSDAGRGFEWGAPTGGEGGRGLALVASLAQRWGLVFDGGTTAWFELDAHAGGGAAATSP